MNLSVISRNLPVLMRRTEVVQRCGKAVKYMPKKRADTVCLAVPLHQSSRYGLTLADSSIFGYGRVTSTPPSRDEALEFAHTRKIISDCHGISPRGVGVMVGAHRLFAKI